MSFTSLHFLAFFPIVTLLYFAVSPRMRWVLLVIASYYFYMSWRPWYALLLLFATVVSFTCGLMIGSEKRAAVRRAYLISGCAINLAVLFVFKYFDFFNTQTRDLMAAVEVEDMIGLVDLQLEAARGDADALPLWRQRVGLLEDLATIRTSPYALAAN